MLNQNYLKTLILEAQFLNLNINKNVLLCIVSNQPLFHYIFDQTPHSVVQLFYSPVLKCFQNYAFKQLTLYRQRNCNF